jgi:hypothetical protein
LNVLCTEVLLVVAIDLTLAQPLPVGRHDAWISARHCGRDCGTAACKESRWTMCWRCAPDLETLIGAFEIELKEAGVTDWPGVFALAPEAASAVDGNRPRLIGLPMLLLNVPIGGDAELIFVDSLAAAATEVLATVPSADQPTLRRLRDRLRAQNRRS